MATLILEEIPVDEALDLYDATQHLIEAAKVLFRSPECRDQDVTGTDEMSTCVSREELATEGNSSGLTYRGMRRGWDEYRWTHFCGPCRVYYLAATAEREARALTGL